MVLSSRWFDFRAHVNVSSDAVKHWGIRACWETSARNWQSSGERLGYAFCQRITSSSQHHLSWHLLVGLGIVWDGVEGLQAPCITMWEALACTDSFRKNYKKSYFRDFFWFMRGRELKQHFEIPVLWDILITALLFHNRKSLGFQNSTGWKFLFWQTLFGSGGSLIDS